MSYRVEYSAVASKYLRDLRDASLLRRFERAIGLLQTEPRPAGCTKLTGLPYWRIRVGDYRVVYRIQDEVLIVLIVEIGHRREIYR
jgi:mRNA interferase RelE/StbE